MSDLFKSFYEDEKTMDYYRKSNIFSDLIQSLQEKAE